MFTDFTNGWREIHADYLHRHSVESPEPLEQPRQGLKRALGETLIAIGERLMSVERGEPVGKAA